MKELIAALSIVANIVLAGGKVAIGILSNSAAVLAEGIHSFMDVISSAIGYIGIKISGKPEDQKHPYGHYKFEVLAGFFITLIIFVTGAGIIFRACQNPVHPSSFKIRKLAFGVMIISALVNEVMARVKIHFGKKENSMALLSDGFHSRVDVYASVAVCIDIFLSKYWIGVDSLLALFKGSAITANLEITLPSTLKVEEATKISDSLREKLMKEVNHLSYVAIQINSHEVATGFYRPAIGRGYGWQRQGRAKGEVGETVGQGSGGYCVCSKCGYKIPHQRGTPCSTLQCPDCKVNLERKRYAQTETV
ncbi:MAG: cation diffusion facilitator family transporter [Chlamydiota bacterium]